MYASMRARAAVFVFCLVTAFLVLFPPSLEASGSAAAADIAAASASQQLLRAPGKSARAVPDFRRELAVLKAVAFRDAATTYVVAKNDSLSGIAGKLYGNPADWPVLYDANRKLIGPDYNTLRQGWRLIVPPLPSHIPAAPQAAAAAAPALTPGNGSPPPPAPPVSSGSDAAHSAFGICVRTAENGGSYAWNTGNGGGAYQFLLSTWEAYGGAASAFGSAGPAYQDQIFDNAVATPGGYMNWSPYDGCWPSGTPQAVTAHLLAAVVHHHPYRHRRLRVFNWARTQRGCWYVYGAAGPCSNGYDCSGLVMRAWEHANVWLPHNTGQMMLSGKLIRIRPRQARKGDIVMFFYYGTAVHTGLVAYKWHWMLDAPHTGAQVGVHPIVNWGAGITHAFYRVKI